MARHRPLLALAGLILAVGVPATAQTLIEPSQAPKAMDVTQFGVPRDAKYVFCNGEDCPERSTKTVPAPKVVAPAPVITRPVAPFVPLQATQPPPELSRAKVEPPPKAKAAATKKKPVRKKRAVQAGCGPDTK